MRAATFTRLKYSLSTIMLGLGLASVELAMTGCGPVQATAVTSASVLTASPSTEISTPPASVIPANYFGLTVGHSTVTPVISYGTTRSWDASPGPDWADSNPSQGVYNFTSLDEFIAANEPSSTNGLTAARDMIYTLGRTPQWASSSPNAPTPYGPGECAPPANLTYWDQYLTAVVTHAAGRIKYWELWNEPNDAIYYCGDIPTLVTLAQHANTIIKGIDPTAVILSPGISGGTVGPEWLSTFLADGGGASVDAIAFHGYWSTNAEDIATETSAYKAVLANYGVSALPLWDTEGSGRVMPSLAYQAAFLSKYYLLQWSEGVSRFLWYGYDTAPEWGQLWTAAGGPNVAATAYAQTYDWMVGATMTTPCSADSNSTWTCGFTRTGYESMALWNSSESINVSVPAQFVQYRDLTGAVYPISGGTVPVGTSPILVETIAKESSTLSFATIPTKTFGDNAFPVFATSASNGAVSYSVVSGPATISGSNVTLTGAGSVALQASQASSGNYVATTATASFSVAPAVPAISFASIANQTFGAAPLQLAVNSVSNGAVTYSVLSGPASVSGSTLTITGAGVISLMATQAASGNYAAGTATTSFSVGAATSAISFGIMPILTFGDPPFTLSIHSPSTGAVSYQLISGKATLAGSTLTLTGAGTVWLSATQAATTNYSGASTKISLIVAPGRPTLSIDPIANTIFGGNAYARLSSDSKGPVTYSIVSGPATISANCITTLGAGTVVVRADQAALGNYTSGTATTSFTVLPKTPALAVSPIANKTYGAAPFTVSVTSPSSGPVTYSVIQGTATVSGSTVTLHSAGTVRIQAVQAAQGNFATATATTVFSVAAGEPTLTFTPIPQQTLSSTPLVVTATSASSGYVYYSVVSGPAKIVSNKVVLTGAGTVALSASQLAQGSYLAATASTSFQVVAASASSGFRQAP